MSNFAAQIAAQQAALHRNAGNEHFKRQDFMEAAICYTQAIVASAHPDAQRGGLRAVL
jgi:hypothetical protein